MGTLKNLTVQYKIGEKVCRSDFEGRRKRKTPRSWYDMVSDYVRKDEI